MTKKRWIGLIGSAVFVAATSSLAYAQAKTPWLHVEVKENRDQQEIVKVNLPLSMVETALDVIKNEKFKDGHFHMKMHGEMTIADLRKLWEEVKKAGDAEFVTVEKAKENVRVARSGGFLLVKVTETGQKESKVDLKVPLPVVDALFSGPGEELNLRAAVQSLQQSGVGEILTVHDRNTDVKIWIE